MVVLSLAKSLVDEAYEFLERQGVGQFGHCFCQPAIIPLDVFLALRCMETAPQAIADETVVVGDGAHIGQFVTKSHNLAVAVGASNLFHLYLPFLPPAKLSSGRCFMLHQHRNTVAKLLADPLHAYVCVFHNVVQHRGGEHLRIVGNGGDNGGGFQRMDDVRESLPTTLECLRGCVIFIVILSALLSQAKARKKKAYKEDSAS